MENEGLQPGAAVGGDHTITGTLPTLADVIAFKEGTAELDHGYYRFISHPRLRRLEDELKARFSCRNCRLTESLQSALLELLLCLRTPGTRSRIVILKEDGAVLPISDATFLPACDREGVSVLVLEKGQGIPPDLGRGDVLLVGLREKEDAGATRAETAAADPGPASAATVIAVLSSTDGRLPVPPPDVPGVKFWVLGLHAAKAAAQAGAVLGSADRLMDGLRQQVKRRGPILSSRAADCLLDSTRCAADAAAPARVARALCKLEGGTHAFLYCSGMTAITRILDALRRPGRSQVVAIGHLYNDTFESLRLARRGAGEAPNIFLGVDELDSLDGLVGDQTAAILTETITNPLSDVPDLAVLSRAARSRGVPLVVDNTIATPENCRPLEMGADYVIHSTTKYLNGRNDHGGGAVIVRSPGAADLLRGYQDLLNDRMSPLDAAVLEKNLDSLRERMGRFNENAGRVAAFLAGHRGVGRVFFNGLPSHRSYATARRILRGPGSVISFTLVRDTREGLRAFYDSRLLGIVKAPSLGSDVTLLCPYTLLTHYDDTDEELAAIGLPRFLVRVAVGCEKDISPVLESLGEALLSSLKA
jgi:cystathionine beta-lyase/cystathionine gamma-synthase